jgi:hypothetical protein
MVRAELSVTLLLAAAVPVPTGKRIGDPPFVKHAVGVVWVQVFTYKIATPVALTIVGIALTVNENWNVGADPVSPALIACQ